MVVRRVSSELIFEALLLRLFHAALLWADNVALYVVHIFFRLFGSEKWVLTSHRYLLIVCLANAPLL